MAAYVMPTASLMLQLSDGTTDQEEESTQEYEPASQITGKALMPNKNSSKNTHGKDISRGKDQSEQVDKNHGNNLHDVKAKTTKRISDESVSGEDDVREDSNKVENEGKPGKRTSRRVTSKRDMGQSKETDISEGDESARSDSFGKSHPAVFNVSERLAASKRKSVPTMSLPDASKRRKAIEKRVFSKPVCSPPVSEDVEEVSELHMVAPTRRLKPRSGLVSRNRVKNLVAVNNEDHTDIIQDSMPLADSLEDEDQSVNRKEKRAGKRAAIPVTSPTKERTKKRGTVSSSPATVRKAKRSNTLDDKSLERSRKEIKKRTTQKGTLQSLKAKYQEYDDNYNLTEPEVSNELDDVDEIVNEQVTGDDDLIDDELTDCYVDEAFPTIESPPVALTSQSKTRRRSPVRKVRQTRHSRLDVSSWKEVSAEDSPVRKQKGNIHKGRGYRERKTQNEVHLNIGSTPDDVYHSDESDGNYDEEDVDKEPVGHEKTIVVSRARRRSEREDTGNTTYHADEGIDSEEEELDFKSTDLDYDFNVSITPRLMRPQPRRSKPLQASDSRQSGSLKRSLMLSDSGIGETPLGRKNQDKINIPRRRSWQPLTPVTPRLEQDDEENSGDAESDEASVRSNGTPGQETLEIKHRKKFVDWSTSGPSTLYDLSISGVTPSRMEGNFKNPMHVSEGARMLSYRSQQFGKPRKLLYDEESFNVQDGEDLINDTSEEEIRNEVQGLIKIAGGEVFKSVRRKRQMIKSFLVRTTEMVLSSNDTRRNEQLEASYSAVKSNRSQLTEQIHSLERDFGKTASTIKEMENTINTFQNTVGKQFKILKGQRQIEEKRFKGVHHLHKSIEAELTKLERNRSEQEATFRAELEKETLKFKKKFLQDTRKQKEDQLKMMLNILQIP
ncbi:eukaryotic translation initiation factor 5B-like isoform X2 [Acropora millepora]|uniref:eukaryotic translation initiation factor 5B-like isoform X2 n=1 Tax=Acropora millepora TaxID=45264 RepID=UPI001CF527F8|nr:eukaryotic translation initiation factor 5B-like isoform X2 [Acropora millepora]